MASPTVEQLHAFHAQDRKIFSKLVLKFARPPAESLLIMATWFWLEDFAFANIISVISALTDPVIVALANEAVACFRCVDSSKPPNEFIHIPFTEELIKKEISLSLIYKHRYTAITGIRNFLTTTCSRVFTDILQRVLPSPPKYSLVFRHPLIIPGFPHPTFGSINVMPDVFVGDNIIPDNNLFLFPHGLWEWNAKSVASDDERTMFITFSRGFPVSQAEVRNFFTKNYGENCVESVYMKEDNGNNSPNEDGTISNGQSLFARAVMDSVATVDRILDGEKIQKFHNNGKHIWVRKFKKKRDDPAH